jgi:hypothetical protein
VARRSALAFDAVVRKVDINPYVRVPVAIVTALLARSGKSAGPIPVKGTLQGKRFSANVVLFRRMWRLYLNGPMRLAAGVEVGDRCTVVLEADRVPRSEPMNAELGQALRLDAVARAAFGKLAPYRRKEILRYLNRLKLAQTRERNVAKVIAHLHGRRIAGRVAVTR